jgi:hypothetical protein
MLMPFAADQVIRARSERAQQDSARRCMRREPRPELQCHADRVTRACSERARRRTAGVRLHPALRARAER